MKKAADDTMVQCNLTKMRVIAKNIEIPMTEKSQHNVKKWLGNQ